MRVAFPSRAGGNVVLEIGVLPRSLADAFNGAFRKRRPAQIRVQDHARGVNHGSQRRAQQGGDLACDLSSESIRLCRKCCEASGDIGAQPFEHGSRRLYDEVAADLTREFTQRRDRQKLIHSRNPTEQFCSPISSCIRRGTHGLHFSIGAPPEQHAGPSRASCLIGSGAQSRN